MSADRPLDFMAEHLPPAFERGMERLRERASAGDARSQTRLADAEAATGAILIVTEGEGADRMYVVVEGGELRVQREAPEGVNTHLSVAGSAASVREALSLLLATGVDLTRPTVRVTWIASAKLARLITAQPVGFAVVLKELPLLDEVSVRIGLGTAEPPATPAFTISAKLPDLQAAREQKMTPPQMLIAGKLQILGDSTKAMQLGLMFMQLR